MLTKQYLGTYDMYLSLLIFILNCQQEGLNSLKRYFLAYSFIFNCYAVRQEHVYLKVG